MDNEEEEKNTHPSTEIPNESVTTENAITPTDTNDTLPELATTNAQCEPEPEPDPLTLSPASQTETVAPDSIKDQVVSSGEALEVGGAEGASLPTPVVEAGESVPEGEGDGGSIGGEETGGVTNDLAVKEEIEYGTSAVENDAEEAVVAEIVEEVNDEKLSDEIETGVGSETVAEVNDKVEEFLMEEKAVVVDKIEEEENDDMEEAVVTTKELEEEEKVKMETDDMEEVGEERGKTVSNLAEVGDTEMAVVAEDKGKEEEMRLDDVVEEAENEIGVQEVEMVKEANDPSEPEEMQMAKEEDATSEPEEMGMAKEADDASEPEGTEMTEEGDDASEPEGTEMTEEADDANEGEETEMADEAEQTIEAEETEMADEAEDTNEVEETEMTVETEGADEEVTKSAVEKRKRGKNAKASTKVSSRKKAEEDVCFICFDGGELVLCDRRGCPKAYHPSCVNRDEAFFRTKGRWNCGWHLCSNCEKNACYMCYTCTFSLCKGCIKDSAILCVRGNKGFCETCMKTVLLIEKDKAGNKEMAQVDFDDKSSWMYFFKDYWTELKGRLSLTSEELATAKNPWKGSDLHGGKQESPDEVYDGRSGSDSLLNAEATPSKRRKAKERFKSRAKERDSSRRANGKKRMFADESVDWASKELLEFVMHMKNGDKSVCSQFDVQAFLLEYIKRNKLRDPRRKSQIICDSRFVNLFGKPRVGHFEMLKLLESHFLVKADSQADVLQESNVDTESNPLEADENSDSLAKSSIDKKRKSRKKGNRRGLQSNLDDFAAIDMHNISLIYLRRSLVEDLIEDTESFGDKAIGSFVRIRISGSAQKQDIYRLVQVIGTKQAAEPYKVGKKVAELLLEILNLNKIEVISMDIISNQDFTEDECKRLRQSIKCGLINRLTVGDIQEKAMALQSVRVKDILETEKTRISHLRDRASDMGKRKQLRECVEKLQLLNSPEERQHRLEEIPEIHADPKMDPSYESEEEDDETDEKRQENYPRPRGSNFSRRGREPVSPHKGSSASNDSWGGAQNRELNKSMSNKGEDAVGASEVVNEMLWSQGREKEAHQSQVLDKMKTASKSEVRSSALPVVDITPLESRPKAAPEVLPQVTQSAANVINEAEKIWHYRDPAGKIQGPFSMLQLRKWNKSGYFPSDLRVWRATEQEDESILLTVVMTGNFLKDPPSVSTLLVTQPVQVLPAPVEALKHSSTVSTDRWPNETNLPSPTPGHSGGRIPFTERGGLQHAARAAIPESGQLSSKLGGRVDGGMSMSQLHAQTLVPSETLRIQQQRPSHPLPVQDYSGASVNPAIDINNTLVRSHGWGANSVARSDVNASQPSYAVGSQAWGNTPPQKLETNNSVSTPSQNVYGSWVNPTGVSPVPGSAVLVPSDRWRTPVPAQQPPSTPNAPWGMSVTDSQSTTARQVPENPNAGWQPNPGNQNSGWGGNAPASSNQGWVAPGQGQGQAYQNWTPAGQGAAPLNANQAWAQPRNVMNPSWQQQQQQPAGNMQQNGDRYSSQADRGGSHGGGTGSGGAQWNRQSSRQRVCRYHESGHCKKGASCDHLHT